MSCQFRNRIAPIHIPTRDRAAIVMAVLGHGWGERLPVAVVGPEALGSLHDRPTKVGCAGCQ